MSLHISAKEGEIAPVLLMPGDPLRAKNIAENMLDNPVLVSSTRNIFFYTGSYRGTRVSIGASGMGCPSIGIYSYELYQQYQVECIMRIGTAGAYTTELKLFDLVNVDEAYSESSYARFAHHFNDNHFAHQGTAFDLLNRSAEQLHIPLKCCNIHSSDVFYRVDTSVPEIAVNNNCLAVEMESFALFANARFFKRSAACLVTISDIIPTGQHITAAEREQSLKTMTRLALESAVHIAGELS